MTTRRNVLRLAGAVPAAALLAACSRNGAASGVAAAGPADLLTVRTSSGLGLIDCRSGAAVLGPRRGVLAIDGSSIASAVGDGADTQVDVSPQNRGTTYHVGVAGALDARVASTGGYLVALATGASAVDAGPTAYRPVGRSETTIVVVGADGERNRLTLPGCVEPEAFSIAGDRLYVLDYLPPQSPERYRVRQVDLAAGNYTALSTRNKELIPPGAEEEMRGEGRQAVYAPVRSMLFTLYTHQPDHEHTRDLLGGGARPGQPHVHAFVHSLSLDVGFAYCIDLPSPFGEGAAAAHAIALAPNAGDHPFVIDMTSGTIARLDGEQLTVADVGNLAPSRQGSEAFATMDPGGRTVFVGSGDRVTVVNASTLATMTTWIVPGQVRGLGMSADGARLWVGQSDRVVALDASSGRPVSTIAVRGLTRLIQVRRAF